MFTMQDLEAAMQPEAQPLNNFITEVLNDFMFSNWRFSYGMRQVEPWIGFIAIYPAFCVGPYAVFHFTKKEDLLNAVNEMWSGVGETTSGGTPLTITDKIAAMFAISRDKESFELFQEQKDLMDLGLKHVHLDNYYQDFIKGLCAEFYAKGTINGKPAFDLKKIPRV